MRKDSVNKGIFYGWFILGVGFFTLFVASGSRNGFGVFIIPMSNDLEWSRGAISLAIALGWFVNGITLPFLGKFYDQLGGRKVICYSLIVLGSATMLLSLVTSLWMLIILYGLLMSTAASGASLVTVGAILSKWFYRKRGAVISISSSGASIGSMILAPFATYLILLLGWRITWGVMGGLVLFIALPLVFFLMKENPADIGEVPDGAFIPDSKTQSDNQEEVVTPLEAEYWKHAYRSAPMWQLSVGYFVCGMTTGILSAHYVPFVIDRPID